MRTFILILVFHCLTTIKAQEWNLTQFHLFSAYTYSYDFHPAKDSSYCSDFTITEQETLKVTVLDYADQAIPFANLVLKDEMGHYILQAISDFNGEYALPIQPGTYTLQIATLGYSAFEQEITITGKGADIIIHFGQNKLIIYNIDSKRILTSKDREKIESCLQFNAANECSETIKNEIRIGIQL